MYQLTYPLLCVDHGHLFWLHQLVTILQSCPTHHLLLHHHQLTVTMVTRHLTQDHGLTLVGATHWYCTCSRGFLCITAWGFNWNAWDMNMLGVCYAFLSFEFPIFFIVPLTHSPLSKAVSKPASPYQDPGDRISPSRSPLQIQQGLFSKMYPPGNVPGGSTFNPNAPSFIPMALQQIPPPHVSINDTTNTVHLYNTCTQEVLWACCLLEPSTVEDKIWFCLHSGDRHMLEAASLEVLCLQSTKSGSMCSDLEYSDLKHTNDCSTIAAKWRLHFVCFCSIHVFLKASAA